MSGCPGWLSVVSSHVRLSRLLSVVSSHVRLSRLLSVISSRIRLFADLAVSVMSDCGGFRHPVAIRLLWIHSCSRIRESPAAVCYFRPFLSLLSLTNYMSTLSKPLLLPRHLHHTARPKARARSSSRHRILVTGCDELYSL